MAPKKGGRYFSARLGVMTKKQDALHELKDLRSQADELRRELKMLTNAAFEAEDLGELDGEHEYVWKTENF